MLILIVSCDRTLAGGLCVPCQNNYNRALLARRLVQVEGPDQEPEVQKPASARSFYTTKHYTDRILKARFW